MATRFCLNLRHAMVQGPIDSIFSPDSNTTAFFLAIYSSLLFIYLDTWVN